MRLSQIEECCGKIVKGVNTTDDVDENSISTEAKKLGFTVSKDGIPPLIYTKKEKSRN